MAAQPDIIVFTKGKQRVLIVEVNGGRQSSDSDAARYRKNLVESGMVEEAPYLLIALPNGLFLWKGATSLGAKADFSAPTKPLIEKFLPHTAARKDLALYPETIQIAVHAWLRDLAFGLREPEKGFAPDEMLTESGLYPKIKFGDIRSNFLS